MEPPPNGDIERLRDEKVKVLRSIRTLKPEDVVRGQFDGYRKEPGVKPESDVETFVALRLQHRFLALAGRAIFYSRRQVCCR